MKTKHIKGKRIIRFHDTKENSKDVSDVVNYEKVTDEVSQQSNTNEQNKEKQLQEERYEAYEELVDCVKSVILNKRASNMIGVFGTNSDNVVRMFCRSNILVGNSYLGHICYSEGMDIYNLIAATLLIYIQENITSSWCGTGGQEIREQLLSIYVSPNEDTNFEKEPLMGLSKIAQKCKRERKILGLINSIKKKEGFRRNVHKYLLTIELEQVNYDVLNKLSKLNDSNLVIIVYYLPGMDIMNRMITPDIFEGDMISRFFPSANCIEAVGNKRIDRKKKKRAKVKEDADKGGTNDNNKS